MDLLSQIILDFINTPIAVRFEPDQKITRVRLGHGQSQTRSGPARITLYFRRVLKKLLEMLQHTVSLRKCRARWHKIIDDERSFVHLGKEILWQQPVNSPGGDWH